MSEVAIYQVEARANDVLYVRGAVDGQPVEATGWLSALTNVYDQADYLTEDHIVTQPDTRPESQDQHIIARAGDRHPDAQPRPMTEAERDAYIRQLLIDATGAVPEHPLARFLSSVPLDAEPEPPAPPEQPAE